MTPPDFMILSGLTRDAFSCSDCEQIQEPTVLMKTMQRVRDLGKLVSK